MCLCVCFLVGGISGMNKFICVFYKCVNNYLMWRKYLLWIKVLIFPKWYWHGTKPGWKSVPCPHVFPSRPVLWWRGLFSGAAPGLHMSLLRKDGLHRDISAGARSCRAHGDLHRGGELILGHRAHLHGTQFGECLSWLLNWNILQKAKCHWIYICCAIQAKWETGLPLALKILESFWIWASGIE